MTVPTDRMVSFTTMVALAMAVIVSAPLNVPPIEPEFIAKLSPLIAPRKALSVSCNPETCKLPCLSFQNQLLTTPPDSSPALFLLYAGQVWGLNAGAQ